MPVKLAHDAGISVKHGVFHHVFLNFLINFYSSRYPIKESRPHEVIAHGGEICLDSHPLNGCYHGMGETEHPLHEGIWVFHQ